MFAILSLTIGVPNLKSKGKSIAQFCEYPKINKLMLTKSGLSLSEWITLIKMSCNSVLLRGVPGRSQNTFLCRQNGCGEIETLPHVLSFCSKGQLLRITRHNKIRVLLAEEFRKNNKLRSIRRNSLHFSSRLQSLNRHYCHRS